MLTARRTPGSCNRNFLPAPLRSSRPQLMRDILLTTVICGRLNSRKHSSTPSNGSRHNCASYRVFPATPSRESGKLSNIFTHPGCGHWSVLVRLRGRDSFPQCRGHPRGPVGCAHQVQSLLAEVPQRSTSRVDCTSTPWRLHQNQPFFQPSTMSTCCSRLQLILDVLRRTVMCGRPTPRM